MKRFVVSVLVSILTLFFGLTGIALASNGFTTSGFAASGFNQLYCPDGTLTNSEPRLEGMSDNTIWMWVLDDGSHTTFYFALNHSSGYIASGSLSGGNFAAHSPNWTTSSAAFTGMTGAGVTWYDNGAGAAGTAVDSIGACGGGGGGSTTTLDSYGLWGAIATSTGALVVGSGVPFWEIALGILIALFLIFMIGRPLIHWIGQLLK